MKTKLLPAKFKWLSAWLVLAATTAAVGAATTIAATTTAATAATAAAAQSQTDTEKLFAADIGRAYIVPDWVEGVKTPFVSLNGKDEWRFQPAPGPDAEWTPVRVPGEVAMQGLAIELDRPFLYKVRFVVPPDFDGRTIILRFDGVYSHAKLRVNGAPVREHHGGFTRWEADITRLARAGQVNEIELEVTDRSDDTAYGSAYAHHLIGGILRDVSLFALPSAHVFDFWTETRLSAGFTEAALDVSFTPAGIAGTAGSADAASITGTGGGEVELRLFAPDAREGDEPVARGRFPLAAAAQKHSLTVRQPPLWDAEHPRLHTLETVLYKGGKPVCRFTKKIGFREVRVDGGRLLVNGAPVKLRGACRHDLHPEQGRSTSAEMDALDARLFKEANMNFVRTSHYPPSEKFVEECDRLGIYIECENSICFHGDKNPGPFLAVTQHDPEYAPRYLDPLREMTHTFRSHASVIIWSLGNESHWGVNFEVCREWIRRNDRSRPIIFSYPGTVPDGSPPPYDIMSIHYPDTTGARKNQRGISVRNFQTDGGSFPVLGDEWAHVPCYTIEVLRDDPGIREYWGASLDRMWDNAFAAPDALGGAIWGYIDEVFHLPAPTGVEHWKKLGIAHRKDACQNANCVGYGEWGIVDSWRRKKPEFWGTKKAFSPVRVERTTVEDFAPGAPLRLAVKNRFDHTRLDELGATVEHAGKRSPLVLPRIAPHAGGTLEIPAQNWRAGDTLLLRFLAVDGTEIDVEKITLGNAPAPAASALAASAQTVATPTAAAQTAAPTAVAPTVATSAVAAQTVVASAVLAQAPALDVSETPARLTVSAPGFEIAFDKTTGLIAGARSRGETVLAGGPWLHLRVVTEKGDGTPLAPNPQDKLPARGDWRKNAFSHKRDAEKITVTVTGNFTATGSFAGAAGALTYTMTSDGRLQIRYSADLQTPRELREAGLAFALPDTAARLQWRRKGHWSFYPAGAFAGNEGDIDLYASRQAGYGRTPLPDQPWHHDTHEYFYWGDAGVPAGVARPLTRQAKGMKENILTYAVATASGAAVTARSDTAAVACRLGRTAEDGLTLFVNNRWDYPDIAWGNIAKRLPPEPCEGVVELQF
jgi:beta-galactosidase/beta-glucuronidase